MIDGREYVLEKPLRGGLRDRARLEGGHLGNLVFRKTARNFSPMMCMAGKITIVEAEHIVQPGSSIPTRSTLPSSS